MLHVVYVSAIEYPSCCLLVYTHISLFWQIVNIPLCRSLIFHIKSIKNALFKTNIANQWIEVICMFRILSQLMGLKNAWVDNFHILLQTENMHHKSDLHFIVLDSWNIFKHFWIFNVEYKSMSSQTILVLFILLKEYDPIGNKLSKLYVLS